MVFSGDIPALQLPVAAFTLNCWCVLRTLQAHIPQPQTLCRCLSTQWSMAVPQVAQQDLPSGGHHSSHRVWTVHAPGHHQPRTLQPGPSACQAAWPAARSPCQAECPACLSGASPPGTSIMGVEWTMTTKHLPQQPGIPCQGHLRAH